MSFFSSRQYYGSLSMKFQTNVDDVWKIVFPFNPGCQDSKILSFFHDFSDIFEVNSELKQPR